MFTFKKPRVASESRKSKETEIVAELNIDGCGETKIKTNIGILDHMLELFAFHGHFNLKLEVKKADTNIDIHHTNEDVGIVLGKLFKKALGDRSKIRRFGFAAAPMEATFSEVIIDLSGRGYCKIDGLGLLKGIKQDGYTLAYLEHFLESFANHLGANLIVNINNVSEDLHTTLETVFKALGLALDKAVQIDTRRKGIPSTKGIID
ncbi:MAG: imidazoleglycerol-phosphate dehydratase [Candidatus Omnitrophota bacterium]